MLHQILDNTELMTIKTCRWEFWKEKKGYKIIIFSSFRDFSPDQRFDRKINRIHVRRAAGGGDFFTPIFGRLMFVDVFAPNRMTKRKTMQN